MGRQTKKAISPKWLPPRVQSLCFKLDAVKPTEAVVNDTHITGYSDVRAL